MKIELLNVTVRELAEGYADRNEDGIFGYAGALDIRPPYQREFIYKDRQRDAVIATVMRNFPLNVMYWAVRGEGAYEIIDGQQRTISVCQFVQGDFAYEGRYFHNLQSDEQERVLEYPLMVYLCSGTDSEKLEWFRTINIAGEKLTDQELRNAVYAGSWVSDAKRYFSKTGCPAYGLGSAYMAGTPLRQEYLETAISWINDGDVEAYMAAHQNDPSANALWLYFQAVMAWTQAAFPVQRREMKRVAWGNLYNRFKDMDLDPVALEARVSQLLMDDDVSNKPGVYPFVLDGDERHLNIRQFTANQRREAYERQEGICAVCSQPFPLEEMEADHITPWRAGGTTDAANCQMLCRDDNRRKGGA